MGEGWSDFYAKDFLVSRGRLRGDTPAAGEVGMGDYTDRAGTPSATRRSTARSGLGGPVPLRRHRRPGRLHLRRLRQGQRRARGPRRRRDLGRDAVGPARASARPTHVRRITGCARPRRSRRSWTCATRSCRPTRRRGRAGATDLVGVRRAGDGLLRAPIDGNDPTPREDFSLPPAPGGPRGRIDGRLTDIETGAGGRRVDGGPLAGWRPARRRWPATPDAGGNFSIANVPARGYPSFLFKAPGYDTLVRPITVPEGGSTTLVARLRRNWSARAGGASATGDQPYAVVRLRRQRGDRPEPGDELADRQRRNADDDRHAAAGRAGHAVRIRQHRGVRLR